MPQPLTLDLDAPGELITAAIVARFGSGSTVLGVVTTEGIHPCIHRAELATPLRPHCGSSSHGRPNPLVTVLATASRPDPYAVVQALEAAGYEACRMCRRCWVRASEIPSHTRCFRKA